MKCEYTLTELAAMYERAGAAGISVLTDTKYFGGTPADMIEVRKHTTVPVLCKEFIVDEYQIYEAAAHQADAVLLIAAILDDERIARFMRLAHDLGIEVLLESHTKSELERSIASGAKLLGINNRNLDTLATDLDTSFELLGLVPEDRVVISESGIKTSADIRQLISAGAQGFLIGESLLKSGNPEQKLGDLIKAAR
jgi:indole-3-glycerol phosphate synthase